MAKEQIIILSFRDRKGNIGFTEAFTEEEAERYIEGYESLGYKLVEKKTAEVA